MPVTNIFSFADLSCIFHIIAFLNPDCQKIDYIGLVGLLVFSYSQNAILRCLMFQQYSSFRPTILRNIDSWRNVQLTFKLSFVICLVRRHFTQNYKPLFL